MKFGVIGHVDCPICTLEADVKEDKGQKAYITCPDCGAQCFSRNDFRDKKLRARMRPVLGTVQPVPEPTPKPAVQPVHIPAGVLEKVGAQPEKPPAVPKPQPAKKNAPTVELDPLPPTKKSTTWFQPLIGSDAQ